MTNRSTVKSLPGEVREALNHWLRNNSYGPLDDGVTFLEGLGHTVSRSALHRYITKLRVCDAREGHQEALLALTPAPAKWTSGNLARVSAIAAELERLQSLQNDLIAQLVILGGAPANTPPD